MEIPLTDWSEYTETVWTVRFDLPWFNGLVKGEVRRTHGGVDLYWTRLNGRGLGTPHLKLEDAKAAVIFAIFGDGVPSEFVGNMEFEWDEKTQTYWTLPCIESFLYIKIWKEGKEYKGTINDREVRTYESLEMAKSMLLGSLYMIVAVSYDQVMAMIDPEYRKGINEHNDAQSGR